MSEVDANTKGGSGYPDRLLLQRFSESRSFAFLLPDSDAYLLRRLFFFMAAICLLYLFIEKLIPTARAPITAINAIKEINVPDIYYSTFLFL